MRFAKSAHVLSCVFALPILLLARLEGQLVPPAFDPRMAADPSRDNPSYRTLVCTFKAGGNVWTLDLHVPRSGNGICYLAEASPTIISEPPAMPAALPLAVPSTHRYGDTPRINGSDEIYQAASVALGNLRTKSGTLYPECKLLTGAPKGVIVVNRANIFVIPRAELDQNSSRIVQAVLPTQS